MSATSPASAEITPAELLQRLQVGETLRMIDVREPDEYEAGHIPGAELLPLDDLPASLDRLEKGPELIMVCRSGRRSGRATAFLLERGYAPRNLVGGMLQWPGPVEEGGAPVQPRG